MPLSWLPVNPGSFYQTYGIVLAGSDLYVTVGSVDASCIFASTDGGNTWTATPTYPTGNGYGQGLAFESGSGTLYATAGGFSPGPGIQPLFFTTDGGTTWTYTSTDFISLGFNPFRVAVSGSLVVAVGGSEPPGVSVAISTDGGTTFTYNTLTDPFPFGAFAVAIVGSRILVGSVEDGAGNTIAYSDDTGATWTVIAGPFGGVPFGSGGVYCFYQDGGTLYAGGADGTTAHTLATSTDSGTTWAQVTNDPGAPYGDQVVAIVIDSGVIVVGLYGLLLSSSDGGTTWDLPYGPFPFSVSEGLVANSGIFVGAGNGTGAPIGLSAPGDLYAPISFRSIVRMSEEATAIDNPIPVFRSISRLVADSTIPPPFEVTGHVTFRNIGRTATPDAYAIPFPPVIVPGPSGLHSYEVIMCDKYGIAQGELMSAVPTEIDYILDDIGTATIDFWVLDPQSKYLPIKDIPGATEIQIWRDNALIWWGWPVSPTYDKDQVHLQCQGLLWPIGQRLFGPVTTNYLKNPSFEKGLTDWTGVGVFSAITTTPAAVLGKNSAELYQTELGADAYLYQSFSFTGAGGIGDFLDLVAWVYVDPDEVWHGPALGSRGLYIQATDTGDVVREMAFQEITANTQPGIWIRLETGIEIPPGAVRTIEVRLYCPATKVYWDACNLAIPESVSSPLAGCDTTIIMELIMHYAQDVKRGKSDLAMPCIGPASGVTLIRTYQLSDNGGIIDALQEFPAISVCDYEVTWDHTGHFRQFQIYCPAKGAIKWNFPVELDLGNLTDLQGQVDGSQVGTAQRVLGQGSTGAAETIGYAVFPSFLGGRVVTDATLTDGSTTVTSATANFTAADVMQGAYSLAGYCPIACYIVSVSSSTTAVMSLPATGTTSADGTFGIGGIILDASVSAYPDQPLDTLYSRALANLTRQCAAQFLPQSRLRADGPEGLFGNITVGDVVPVKFSYGWLTYGPALMRIASMTLYPPTEELAINLMVVNAVATSEGVLP